MRTCFSLVNGSSNDLLIGFLAGCVCLSALLIGLIFCTGAGEYWVGMFDTFAGSMGLIVIAFFETIVISYVYGHKKFSDDIEKMIGERPGIYWQAMWRFISPLTIFSIVVASVYYRVTHPPDYPAWKAEMVSWKKFSTIKKLAGIT